MEEKWLKKSTSPCKETIGGDSRASSVSMMSLQENQSPCHLSGSHVHVLVLVIPPHLYDTASKMSPACFSFSCTSNFLFFLTEVFQHPLPFPSQQLIPHVTCMCAARVSPQKHIQLLPNASKPCPNTFSLFTVSTGLAL